MNRTPAKPLITPLFSDYDQSMVYNGGSLSAITKGGTVLLSSSVPPVLNQGNGGRVVLPLSSMQPSQSRNLAKTRLYNTRLSGRTTARPMKESRKTITLISTVTKNLEIIIGPPTAPGGPDQRPSITMTSATATRPVDTDSMFNQL